MHDIPRSVTTPHTDLLNRARAALTSWQYDTAQAEATMAQVLTEGDVFLDQDGAPVVPTWWDRTAEGRGRWLVWPAGYARESSRPRRERIDDADVDGTEAKRRRTQAYQNAYESARRLSEKIDQAGRDLEKLAVKYGW